MSNMAISMNNLDGARVNAGLDVEDVRVDNEYNELDSVSAQPGTCYMSNKRGTIGSVTEQKSPSKTEIAKLILLGFLIGVVIVVGVIILAVVLIGLKSHDHEKFKKTDKAITNLEEEVNNLRENLAAHDEQLREVVAHGEDLASLRDDLQNIAEELDPSRLYTEEECLADHDNAVYAGGICYFVPSIIYTVTWKEAILECKALGGQLASPRTEEQWQAVYSLTRAENSFVGFLKQSALWRDMAGNGATDNVAAKLGYDNSSYFCVSASSMPGYVWPKFLRATSCTKTLPRFVCESEKIYASWLRH